MATRQYIGARYIPVFADPVEWDNTNAYQYLTMVQHQGETYMSRQAVPVGIDLPDTSQGEESNEYWVHMSNWNAQVETYRQEVLQYNGRISTLEDDLPISFFDSENTVKDAIDDLNDALDDLNDALGTGFDSTNTISDTIGSGFDSTNTISDTIGSGFNSSNSIADNIETLSKAKSDIVNVVEYGIKNDGSVDVTSDLQTIINNAPIGSTVVFPKGIYLISSITLKSGIEYDFCDSKIEYSGDEGIKTPKQLIATTTLSSDYGKYQNNFTVTDATDFEVGMLLEVQNPTESVNSSRAYYTKGCMFEIKKINGNVITVNCGIPYNILAANSTVKVYKTNHVQIRNIGEIEHVGSSSYPYGIRMYYCLNSTIENIRSKNSMYSTIGVIFSVSCQVKNCNINYLDASEWENNYPISIYGSSYCTVSDCNCFNNNWHAIDFSGEFTAYNNKCINSVFSSNGKYAFSNHDSQMMMIVENCQCDGMSIASPCIVTNCVIENNFGNALVSVGGKDFYCGDTIFKNTIIRCTNSNDTDFRLIRLQGRYVFGNIVIENCKLEHANSTESLFKVYGNGIKSDGSSIDKFVCINTDNLYLDDTSVTVAHCSEILHKNCRFTRGQTYMQKALDKSVFDGCTFDFSETTDGTIMAFTCPSFENQIYFNDCLFIQKNNTTRTKIVGGNAATHFFFNNIRVIKNNCAERLLDSQMLSHYYFNNCALANFNNTYAAGAASIEGNYSIDDGITKYMVTNATGIYQLVWNTTNAKFDTTTIRTF